MAKELKSEIFDTSHLPEECIGGVALSGCAYTQNIIRHAETFTPDHVLSRVTNNKAVRHNSLYPPKITVGEGKEKKTIIWACDQCGGTCIAKFEMEGHQVRVGSPIELEYELTIESPKDKSDKVMPRRLPSIDFEGKL